MTKVEQKQEKKLNELLAEVKKLPLDQDEINFINIQMFCYNVGRESTLQMVALLTFVLISHNVEIKQIMEVLKDETH